MPETEGNPVGTADMHGGGVTFKDRDGNDVSFEVVRLGTSKELETVKGALATANSEIATRGQGIGALHEKLAAMTEKLTTNGEAYQALKAESLEALAKKASHLASMEAKLEQASNAYSTEKEVSAELTKANQGLAEGIKRQKDTIADLTKQLAAEKVVGNELDKINVGIAAEIVTARAELVAANDVCADRHHDLEMASGERDDAMAESSRRYDCHGGPGMSEPACGACVSCLTHVIEAKDAELAECSDTDGRLRAQLANKDSELASQNEITDGLSDEAESFRAEIAEKDSEFSSVRAVADVAKIERDRYEKERDDTKAAFVSLTERQARGERDLLEATRDRDASRQALADLKAELLRDASHIGDALTEMAAKITGE